MKELIELVLVRGQAHVMNSTTEAFNAGKSNCRPRFRRPPDLSTARLVTADMKREFLLMRNKGMTWDAIGKHFGLSETTVRRHVNGRR